MTDAAPSEFSSVFADHTRQFERFRYVYPVVSRRSGGVSVGINLNPDKVCNFDCIYCQVDRVSPAETEFVALEQLLGELRTTLELAATGEIFAHPRFANTPPEYRRLCDMAFSGDGEPTSHKNFDEVVAACCRVKGELGLADLPVVLITNASLLHRPAVQRGLAILDAHHGEIWAKLEAGTAEYFQLIERTSIPFQQVLDNIRLVARQRPIVIQALWMRIAGEAPPPAEIEAFCDRLNEIVAGGGRLKLVQIYTVARKPAESSVTPLSRSEVDALVATVRARTGLLAQGFYGPDSPPE